ncbi:DUF6712 family protein [Xanthocytophaga agilis]|uniref:Uncharacterized protein n=1 Tax=Xanthocytophaga agilis TaxID=3048010 RepID=A0AAE3QYN1_9BACT|nr:DUF6712 family protein [Xanthocytophaga agilis]MDJ1500459.1 hypothetical protein [Xanthocytophaga agilis]
MPLIKTIQEVKNYVSVGINNEFETITPDLIQAHDRVLKLLGSTQYTALETAYDAGPVTGEIKSLLEFCQGIITNLCYAEFITPGQLDISDSGFRIQVDGEYKTAFQWQIDDLKLYFRKKAADKEEKMLAFLEEKSSTFPDWANSPASTLFRQYFINSTSEYQDHYNIASSRLTFLALIPTMKYTETFSIEPNISPALFAKLKDQIQNKTLTDKNKLLITYIQPAVAYLTICNAIDELPVEIKENALVVNEYRATGENYRQQATASDKLLVSKKASACVKGNDYLQRLIAFLNANADDYPEYKDSGLYKPPTETIFVDRSSKHLYGGF